MKEAPLFVEEYTKISFGPDPDIVGVGRTLDKHPVISQASSLVPNYQDGIRNFSNEQLPPNEIVAIELIDSIPELSLLDKASMLAYYLWHLSSPGIADRNERLKQVMGISDPRQARTIRERVLSEPDLERIYEQVAVNLLTSQEIVGINRYKPTVRKLRQFSLVIWEMQDSENPPYDKDKDPEEAILNIQSEINSIVKDLSVEEVEIELQVNPALDPERKKSYVRILLEDKISYERIGEILGMEVFEVSAIKRTLDKERVSTNKQNQAIQKARKEAIRKVLEEHMAVHGMEPIAMEELKIAVSGNTSAARYTYDILAMEQTVPPLGKSSSNREYVSIEKEFSQDIVEATLPKLTPSQRDVAMLIWGIWTDARDRAQVAELLNTNLKNVSTHLHNIARKLRYLDSMQKSA